MASERPKCRSTMSCRRCSIWRSASSACGGDSLTMPVFAICFRIWYMSEVVSAIGQVEGFVDQRKVRHDVAEHRALEQRPVLPRWIVRVHAMRPPLRAHLEGDEDIAAPAFDPAAAARPGRGRRAGLARRPGGKALREQADE